MRRRFDCAQRRRGVGDDIASNAIIVGAPVSWTSSNESVATVCATGQVAAVGAGIATITAQSATATATGTIAVGSVLGP